MHIVSKHNLGFLLFMVGHTLGVCEVLKCHITKKNAGEADPNKSISLK